MNEKLFEAKAQALIQEGVALYSGNDNPPSKKTLNSSSVHKLSHQQVVQGVTALILQCNIASGSAGDIDLYKLNSLYLRDPEVRQTLNEILKDRRLYSNADPSPKWLE